jgi:hypothetical protein
MNPETLYAQAALAVIVTHGLEALKKTEWVPWLRMDTKRLAHGISVVMAFLSAVGISLTMEGSLLAGGRLMLAWPPAEDLAKMIMTFATSYGAQRHYYERAVKPAAPAVVFTALNRGGGGLASEKGTGGTR